MVTGGHMSDVCATLQCLLCVSYRGVGALETKKSDAVEGAEC